MTNYLMGPYDEALKTILEKGVERTNQRTKIKTLSRFGLCSYYDLSGDRFPLLTRRKISPKAVFAELIWFLSGSTNNEDLKKLGCNFWTPWVDEEFEKKNGFAPGSFGPVYGFQLRHFGGFYGTGVDEEQSDDFIEQLQSLDKDDRKYGEGGFDQLSWLVNRIKEDPSCRRTLFTLWNPQQVGQMRLPPCHMLYQVLVDDQRRLTGILYQRSCDFPVGVPANIQFYSALTIMIAQQTNCTPHEFVHMTADSHIYADQIDAVKKYLETPIVPSPKLEIKPAESILDYKPENFVLSDFNPGPKIEIPVAV